MTNTPSRLKELRKLLGIKQGELALKAGLKQGSLSDIERGKNRMTFSLFKIIVNSYNVNPFWLMNGEGDVFMDAERKKQNGTGDSGMTKANIELMRELLLSKDETIASLKEQIELLKQGNFSLVG